MLFAGISGSALADAAGPGALVMRMMNKAGYDEYYSAALTAATATIGPIIPPSIIMVIYAITDSKVTVAGLFLAGVVPGVLMGLALCLREPRDGDPAQLPLPLAPGELAGAAAQHVASASRRCSCRSSSSAGSWAASSPPPRPRRWRCSTPSSSGSSSPRS